MYIHFNCILKVEAFPRTKCRSLDRHLGPLYIPESKMRPSTCLTLPQIMVWITHLFAHLFLSVGSATCIKSTIVFASVIFKALRAMSTQCFRPLSASPHLKYDQLHSSVWFALHSNPCSFVATSFSSSEIILGIRRTLKVDIVSVNLLELPVVGIVVRTFKILQNLVDVLFNQTFKVPGSQGSVILRMSIVRWRFKVVRKDFDCELSVVHVLGLPNLN